MNVVALTTGDGADIPALLLTEDIELRVAAVHPARIQEIQLLICHCICDLIDKQIFGG
jgi:D-sedoheptulose 7-phosphate isomerase